MDVMGLCYLRGYSVRCVMDNVWGGLICLLLGAFLAANLPFLRKLLSAEEFFFGLLKGLSIGENMKKGKEKRRKK